MKQNITVRELRKALEGVPDDLEVMLSSDTGLDQGEGEIIIEMARRVTYGNPYGKADYFQIYANEICEEG